MPWRTISVKLELDKKHQMHSNRGYNGNKPESYENHFRRQSCIAKGASGVENWKGTDKKEMSEWH